MKQIRISQKLVGMIVAKPVYDEKDRMLITPGVKLTEMHIKKLIEKGYQSICIETKDTEGIELDDVVPVKIQNKAAQAVQNLDMSSILESAMEIVECICGSQNISFDLMSMRNEKNYEYQHAVTVAELSIAVGKLVTDEKGNSLSQNSLRDLAVAALLHDIGKRCADRKFLEQLKLPMNQIEYTEALSPVFSYNLLKENSLITSATRVGILFHKTDENGMGAPAKIDPQKLHLFSKILHITDTYDMLISGEKPISAAEAIEYLMANCDTKFNRELVKKFIYYIPIYPKGSRVILSNGMKATVYENTVGRMSRPKVILEDGRRIDLFEYPSITVVQENINYEEVSNDVKSR